MEAKETTLNAIFNGEKQYRVPVFQRAYSWKLEQCRTLFDDVLALSKRQDGSTHFVGSIVYTANAARAAGVDRMSIIDGQQRITTLSLLVVALMRDARLAELQDVRRVKNFYLVNGYEAPDSDFYTKLRLTDSDHKTYLRLVEGHPVEGRENNRLTENLQFLQNQVAGLTNLEAFYNAIGRLDLVYISLSQDRDNAQLVFESLNSTGLSLSQTDLVRNLLLMGLDGAVQSSLYNAYWLPMEAIFRTNQDRFDAYMAAFLAVEGGVFPRKDRVYQSFKVYMLSQESGGDSREAVLNRLLEYAKIYGSVALGTEENEDLREAFRRFSALDSAVLTPLLMSAYRAYNDSRLSLDGLLRLAGYLESYLVRRTVCELRPNGLDKTAQIILRGIDPDDYESSFITRLGALIGTARFPQDGETRRSLETFKLYEARRMPYILERLENSYRPKEPIKVGSYTIEHIMPQTLTKQWLMDLGEKASEIHQGHLHVLGNLTITGYNSELGNRSFADKKFMENGFDQSPLHLNSFMKTQAKWDEKSIETRGFQLAERFITVWQAPAFSDETELADDSTHGIYIGRSVSILDLISAGYLEQEAILVWERRNLGETHYAALTDAGQIQTSDGETFDSPSAAAKHAAGGNPNGWRAWKIDDWDSGFALEEIRGQYLDGAGVGRDNVAEPGA